MRYGKRTAMTFLAAAMLAPAGAGAGFDPIRSIRAAHERHVAHARKVHREVRETVASRHATHRRHVERAGRAVAQRHREHVRHVRRAAGSLAERHAEHRRALAAMHPAQRRNVAAADSAVRTAHRRHYRFARSAEERHERLIDWLQARHHAALRFRNQHRPG